MMRTLISQRQGRALPNHTFFTCKGLHSLKCQARTLLIVNISPAASTFPETCQSLIWGSKVREGRCQRKLWIDCAV